MTMWQKARFINSHGYDALEGREIWVTGNPYLSSGVHPITGWPATPMKALKTNLLGRNGNRLAVVLEDIELLGGDDAFASVVPHVPFLDWIAEQKGKQS